MTKRGTIFEPTYGRKVTIIFTDKPIKEIVNRLYKKYNEAFRLDCVVSGFAMGLGDPVDYYAILKCINNEVTINVFAHELNHIKNYILKDSEVHYNRQKDEAGAYLVGHLSQLVYKLMQKKGIIFKK